LNQQKFEYSCVIPRLAIINSSLAGRSQITTSAAAIPNNSGFGLAMSYGGRRPAFDLCWRAAGNTEEILSRAVAGQRSLPPCGAAPALRRQTPTPGRRGYRFNASSNSFNASSNK
jgi:hypothetical protein